MPSLALSRAFLPAFPQRGRLGHRYGVHRELLKRGDQPTASAFGGQTWDVFNEPRHITQAFVDDDGFFNGSRLASRCAHVGTRQGSSGHQSAQLAVASDAIEGAFLNGHARVDIELTFFIDASDDVANHGNRQGQPCFNPAMECFVEHDGLSCVHRHQLEVGREFSKRSNVIALMSEQMFDHPAFKTHPAGEHVQHRGLNTVLSDVGPDLARRLFLVFTFHGKVGHDRFFPTAMNHMVANDGGDRAAGAEPLWSDPVWEVPLAEGVSHVAHDALHFIKGLVVGQRRSRLVAATPDHDREPVTTVVSKPNFLMGPSEDFNLHIGQFDTCHFVHGCVDHKQLAGDGPLVFGSGEEDSIFGDVEFLAQLVAETVGFPVGQRDLGHREPAAVVEVNGRCDFLHTEIGHTSLDSATNAVGARGVAKQTDGLGQGVHPSAPFTG